MIENAATLLEGYNVGYRITGLVQIFGGLVGLLLLRSGRRDGTAFAARPRKDCSVAEATTPPWRARLVGSALVADLAVYWRSYLTTRRTRPHSPGRTT